MSPTAFLTVILFVLVGGYFLVRLVTERSSDNRLFDLSHLLMSTMMIMMAAGWSTRIPAALQITAFTAFALWYVYLAMFRPTAVSNPAPSPRLGHHHAGRPRLIYHAAMMLAMVWMTVIMAPLPSADADGLSSAQHQSGHHHGATDVALPAHPWADPVSIALGIAFTAATLWYLVRFVRLAGTPSTRSTVSARHLTDVAASAAMSAGMAAAFLWEMT